MKLTFCGAARQVTGSMYLLELEDDYTVLIDCGTDMKRDWFDENETFKLFPFDVSDIDLVLLTHAHIDHSGNIPNLYKEGYEGQVLCTSATEQLTNILLIDSANLNQSKIKRAEGESNKKRKSMERINKRPDIFLQRQVDEAIKNFITIPFKQRFRFKDNGWVTFYPAGHLLGAAHIVLEVIENGVKKSIGFSGDLGRKNYPLHLDPCPIPQVDYLLCETTYGSRNHINKENQVDALAEVIQKACIDIPGRLIIPSFSVGRTQALLYTLNKLYTERGFKPVKVFSDSPLAYSSTKIYQKFKSLLNPEAKEFLEENHNLFDFENLQYIESSKASKMISNYHEPCIIISSSGMVQGGRVEQHVAENISNPYCTILMIGFAAEGTLGSKLLEGNLNTLTIKGKEMPVLAKIQKIDVFSGHGDQDDLIEFVKHQNSKALKNIFLIHGDENAMNVFKEKLHEHDFENVEIPFRGQSYQL